MKIASMLVCMLVLFIAAPRVAAFETGHDLLEASVRNDEFRAYVSGIMEGHMLTAALNQVPQSACPTPETTRQELAGVVVLYLLNAPSARLDLPARALVLHALSQHYPCPQSQ